MHLKKILFVDRDGTLIHEPASEQVNTLDELELVDDVVPSLLKLRAAGYRLVMVTNQDGLGSAAHPHAVFQKIQEKLLRLFASQGIQFDDVLICPHLAEERCHCRKPQLGLVKNYLADPGWDRARSYVIGDRETDLALAANMGVCGYRMGRWAEIAAEIVAQPRKAQVERKTNETVIHAAVNLDGCGTATIQTGLPFFDHMLEQLAKHANLDLTIHAQGDVHVDEHHTVEDVAIVLGEALRRALGDKVGIERYGCILPMDEANATVSCDMSGRPYLMFEAVFTRDRVGDLPTEMVEHFFRSLVTAFGITLHIAVTGANDHHKIEAVFKGVARCFKMALVRHDGVGLPSTKGLL